MKYFKPLALAVFLCTWLSLAPDQPDSPAFAVPPDSQLASTSPMGWNSFDSYCGDVTEAEVKANADYVAKYLARYGYKYVVVDYYWYFPHPGESGQEENLEVAMDEYGRLLPAPNRFPSAAQGKGFRPLADYVHRLGLKFGIHIMRGIPRAAVKRNLPVWGRRVRAQDIANLRETSSWSTAMYGVNTRRAAGRAYYDSIARLYAEWGVDFIKADDMTFDDKSPVSYHAGEIKALREAMDKTGRPMVLSLSPGPTDPKNAEHVKQFAEMWRISDDFWDDWKMLKDQFGLCRRWVPEIGPHRWPDADMLPLGRIRIRGFSDGERRCRLSHDEQITLMSLWSIFRSPLMMGGDLPSNDDFTLSLLTNEEVLAVDQHSSGNRELFSRGSQIAWTADAPEGGSRYLAVFNLADDTPAEITVRWSELGFQGRCAVRDLWQKKDLGPFAEQWTGRINPHGAQLLRITPLR